jgi:hypothetical protein
VVRLAAAGEAFTGATEGGLHFADPATGAGVRYGAATWVDARGRRSAPHVAWDDGGIVLTVPAETVEASAYPAVLDPVIGPELGMDAPIFAPAPQWFGVPAVAWGGGSYLVAWPDARRVSVAPAAIFAARVSPAGERRSRR